MNSGLVHLAIPGMHLAPRVLVRTKLLDVGSDRKRLTSPGIPALCGDAGLRIPQFGKEILGRVGGEMEPPNIGCTPARVRSGKLDPEGLYMHECNWNCGQEALLTHLCD